MEENQTDAKVVEAPSTSTSPVAEQEPQKPAEVQAQEPSLADVAKQAYEESTKSLEVETEEGKKEEGAVQELDKTSPEEKKPGEKKEDEPGKAKDEEEQPPFHEHPRWKEVVSQRDEARTKLQEYEAKVKNAEPVLKQHEYHETFLKQYGISQEQFTAAMNFLALQNTNPAEALKVLKPTLESLQAFDPNVLPADLTKRVDDGELSEAAAREISQLRVQARGGEFQSKMTAKQQAEQAQRSLDQSVMDWDMGRRQTDPDFRPKADEKAPDGLWEVVADRFHRLMTTQPPKSGADAVKHLEAAYAAGKTLFTSRLTPKPTKPTLTSVKSSVKPSKSPEDAESIRGTVAAVAAQHGIQWD